MRKIADTKTDAAANEMVFEKLVAETRAAIAKAKPDVTMTEFSKADY